MLLHDFQEFYKNTFSALLQSRSPEGHWEGELSSSALSTATAIFTFHLHDHQQNQRHWHEIILAGSAWLTHTQNSDGGWGDTDKSLSNISTTALCWAAQRASNPNAQDSIRRAETWLSGEAGGLSPEVLAPAIIRRYGKDHTFSVPILAMLAIAGCLGERPWKLIPQLPFEIAALPFSWFQFLQLPVVSYALPALIAIGQVRHHHRPTWNPVTRFLRTITAAKTRRLLLRIQPTTGGYLEATPLTSFVTMSLIAAGHTDDAVVQKALEFLENSMRPDGSWPIDTNLATWVTSLAVNATPSQHLDLAQREYLCRWLLQQQYQDTHPYTQAAPGGWAWTPLSGGVPDADDTPGALLAIRKLGEPSADTVKATTAGVTWLLDLQNRDGGIPTFCRGWTGLPFDRSSTDLTAHTLLAWSSWHDVMPSSIQDRISRAATRGYAYLRRSQAEDGSWAPLWFGNQHSQETPNLTYGTSRVLRLEQILGKFHEPPGWTESLAKAKNWLLSAQSTDGGWGGRVGTPCSIEETALALEVLGPSDPDAIRRGMDWLNQATKNGTEFPASPIGFYFANLWYYEKLYPILYTCKALSMLTNQPR
ncbi:MAG: prenyltransferase/squalene oxidase repeat-containing protein [Fimbriiglobus sp.]